MYTCRNMKCDYFLLAVFLVLLTCIIVLANNVCKTFPDYYLDLNNNPNCYFNPDMDLTVPEIIQRHGYPVETHQVTTKDGYILTVFRIPYGKNSITQQPGPPVFLQHGITLNSACFVVRGDKSLGFILADAGYDVWLGNFRGSLYSTNHTSLNVSSTQFWDFSFHENGVYDLPAQLGRVYDTTNQKIIYIGYSMGTTSVYIYSTTYPNQAFERIKIIISLAPIAFMKYVRTVVKYILPLWTVLEPPLNALTNGQLQLRNPELTKTLCLPYPFQMQMCEFVTSILFGFDYGQDDPETIPITLVQNLDDVSVKTVGHYIQLMMSGKFKNFDYGVRGNSLRYGFPAPPQYDFSKLRVPVYLVRGENDLLGTRRNVETLAANLPAQANPYEIYVVKLEKFNHADFLVARDVIPLLYDHIIEFLAKL